MATRGFEHVTLDQARQMGKQVAKPSKYRNVKTTVDGLVFDSAKEARRYGELKALEHAGEIHGLTLQPSFALNVRACDAPVSVIIGHYRGDFSYETTGGMTVVEDVKGMKTALYQWKKKHVEAQYGITIREI